MGISYLRTFSIVILAGICLIAGLNLVVDPYSLYGILKIEGFNAAKADFVNHLRLTKAHRVAAMRPNAIILGTSRTARGLSPDHKGWNEKRCYNLALPASSSYESLRYFQHANAIQPLETVVVGLDLRSFVDDQLNAAFSENRMAVTANGARTPDYVATYLTDIASTLVSSSALITSVHTIRFQNWLKKSLLDNGRYDRLSEDFAHRKAFHLYTENTFRLLADTDLNRAFSNSDKPAFVHYRALLRSAYAADLDMHLLISPSHAWHWEALHIAGIWKHFEDWKKILVHINDEEARRADKDPFPLWDFSGYTVFSTEDPPLSGDDHLRMKWFWDPVHYKVALGDLVLNRIFGLDTSIPSLPADFGILLTSDSVDNQLKNIRQARNAYMESHAEEIKEIARIFRQTL